MARVPVKLSRGEIVLPPRVAQQYRERLEAMNAAGLQAREWVVPFNTDKVVVGYKNS